VLGRRIDSAALAGATRGMWLRTEPTALTYRRAKQNQGLEAGFKEKARYAPLIPITHCHSTKTAGYFDPQTGLFAN
jgi:hypothetical protein